MSPEDALRRYEGRELMDEHPKQRNDALKVLCYGVLFALMLGIIAFGARAQTILIARGYVCDSIEQVIEMMENVSKTSTSLPDIEGCGALQVPLWASIKPLHAFETRHARFTLIELDFGDALGIQYGYSSFTLKPEERGS